MLKFTASLVFLASVILLTTADSFDDRRHGEGEKDCDKDHGKEHGGRDRDIDDDENNWVREKWVRTDDNRFQFEHTSKDEWTQFIVPRRVATYTEAARGKFQGVLSVLLRNKRPNPNNDNLFVLLRLNSAFQGRSTGELVSLFGGSWTFLGGRDSFALQEIDGEFILVPNNGSEVVDQRYFRDLNADPEWKEEEWTRNDDNRFKFRQVSQGVWHEFREPNRLAVFNEVRRGKFGGILSVLLRNRNGNAGKHSFVLLRFDSAFEGPNPNDLTILFRGGWSKNVPGVRFALVFEDDEFKLIPAEDVDPTSNRDFEDSVDIPERWVHSAASGSFFTKTGNKKWAQSRDNKQIAQYNELSVTKVSGKWVVVLERADKKFYVRLTDGQAFSGTTSGSITSPFVTGEWLKKTAKPAPEKWQKSTDAKSWFAKTGNKKWAEFVNSKAGVKYNEVSAVLTGGTWVVILQREDNKSPRRWVRLTEGQAFTGETNNQITTRLVGGKWVANIIDRMIDDTVDVPERWVHSAASGSFFTKTGNKKWSETRNNKPFAQFNEFSVKKVGGKWEVILERTDKKLYVRLTNGQAFSGNSPNSINTRFVTGEWLKKTAKPAPEKWQKSTDAKSWYAKTGNKKWAEFVNSKVGVKYNEVSVSQVEGLWVVILEREDKKSPRRWVRLTEGQAFTGETRDKISTRLVVGKWTSK